jgi:hypothetical protein
MSTTEAPPQPLTSDGEPLTELAEPSRSQLERQRKAKTVYRGPSGATYRLRKVNLERHALSGGLPVKLRKAAMEGVKGLERLLATEEDDAAQGITADAVAGDGAGRNETRDYLDDLVLATVVAPALKREDLGTGQLDDDPLLPAVDYAWLVKVAMGEEQYDGDGRRLWGLEPLDRFATFRAFHGCDADCEGCDGLRHAVSALVGTG